MSQENKPEMSESELIQARKNKLLVWREKTTAYPNTFKPDALAQELQEQFADKTKEMLAQGSPVFSIAGRIIRQRGPFIVVQDKSGQIQFYVNRKVLENDKLNEIKSWDMGDIIYGQGQLQRSGKGDLYINLTSAELLVKSLRPLPDKFHGLQDLEICYRQRYLDLMVNEETRKVFIARSKITQALRDYLIEQGFMEVETPMMQAIPGGATAEPFVTYHHSLDQEMYLRIAPELYLKRLVVGGFEKVFELNRNFRNEGLSTRHNPEFTMLELYQSYCDYKDIMIVLEEMIKAATLAKFGILQFDYQEVSFDFSQPFECLTVLDSIIKYNPSIKLSQLSDIASARQLAEKLEIKLDDNDGLGKVQIEIFEKTTETKLIQPTFITQYPVEVSPLARCNDDDDFVTDRFELFIAGRELANGFSELNDPEDQARRFSQQVEKKSAGDNEAMHFDADYIKALEYGMPPTAGLGLGVDRLVMLLNNANSIRDVLLFPHLRKI